MKQFFVILSLFLLATTPLAARKMKSPNGRLTLTPEAQGLRLSYQGQQVLDIPVVGFGASGTLDFRFSGKIETDYHMLIGKRASVCPKSRPPIASPQAHADG